VIVADTNLLVYLYVDGEHTGAAESVLVRDSAWAAPLRWRSEFRNSLVGLIRRGSLVLEDALQMTREAEAFMAGREYSVVTHRVLQLAARSGCSAYDCEFVALAQDLGVPLVTADRRVVDAFPAAATALEVFVRASRP
jgi:predicted nucleic acid-binding protein